MKSSSLAITVMLLAGLLLSACGGGYRPAPVHDRSIDRQRPVVDNAGRAPVRSDHYTVSRGDTLYSIAFRYNLNYLDLAEWNGIGEPYTIYPGQRLGLTRTAGGYSATNSGLQTIPARQPGRQSPRQLPPTPSTGSGNAANTTSGNTSSRTTTRPARPAAPPASKPPVTASAATTRNSSGIQWLWPVAGGRVNRSFVAGENSRQGLDIGGSPGQPIVAAAAGTVVYSGPGLTGYAELIIIKHNEELLSAYGHNRRRLVQEGESVNPGQQIAELGRSPRGEDELHFQIRRLGKPQNPQNYLPKR